MKQRFVVPVLLAVGCLIWPLRGLSEAPALVELKKGDHICLVGNALADRMQHYGWFEALVYSKFSGYDLVFRNLGFSGDEVSLKERLRSEKFGTPDEHLTFNKADVIFAFFGFNESFDGPAGLDKFKKGVKVGNHKLRPSGPSKE